MVEVTGKIRSYKAANPLGAAHDVWEAFREIEIIDYPLEFRFRHSLGKVSRFFIELEYRRLMATQCPRCETVWMPPRATCGNDMEITEWVELSGRGTLAAASRSAYTLNTDGGAAELVLGYVALEGASTLMLQQIRNCGQDHSLSAGLPLKICWADDSVRHPMELFWFEPM